MRIAWLLLDVCVWPATEQESRTDDKSGGGRLSWSLLGGKRPSGRIVSDPSVAVEEEECRTSAPEERAESCDCGGGIPDCVKLLCRWMDGWMDG